MSLYLLINLASVSVPFLVSFHPRLALHKQWRALLLALLLAMTPFVIWDIYFTEWGVWGFNPDYLLGTYLFNLPLEEILFFICIPFACIFTHYAILEIKDRQLNALWTTVITITLLGIMMLMGVLYQDQLYTSWDGLFGIAILGLTFYFNYELLSRYLYTFLFMLIPFLIVNGILTGTGIESEIVWYNNDENLGIRVLTIPVEDFLYAFSMILLNLFLYELFRKKSLKY